MKPYWNSRESLGMELVQQFDSLHTSTVVDLCIIGGGITGVLSAFWLSEMGIKVALIEKDLLGAGATGRNTGFILTGTVEHYNRAVKLYSKKKAKRIFEFTVWNQKLIQDLILSEKIECGYSQDGSLLLATTEQEGKELIESFNLLTTDGFVCEFFNKKECSEYLDNDQFFGGLRFPKDAGFDPVRFIHGITKSINKKNVFIYEHSKVITIESIGTEGSLKISTEKGKINCAMALLCTNAYTSKIADEWSDFIVPVQGQAFVTNPVQKSMFKEVIYANFGYEYWRQLPDGRLMVGGFREHQKSTQNPYSENVDDDLLQSLYHYMTKLFPDVQNVNISHAWAGTMGFSKDGIPVLGSSSKNPTQFVCGGFTGHGLGFAAGISKIAGELMIEGYSENSDLFHPKRFNS